MPRGFDQFGLRAGRAPSDPYFGANRLRGADLRAHVRKVQAAPYAYETVRVGNRKKATVTRPKFDRSGREFSHFKSRDYSRDILQEYKRPLLAQAGDVRRTQIGLRSGNAGASIKRPRVGYDLAGKLRDTRSSIPKMYLPYRGRYSLGANPTHQTPLGKSIWQFTQRQRAMESKNPKRHKGLGSCWRTTLKRLEAGYKATYGRNLQGALTREEKHVIDTIAGSRHERKKVWRRLPPNLRYRGVPGVGAVLGLGRIVDSKEVWSGALEPGAPLQTWQTSNTMGGAGHSAVFERYVRDTAGKIIGLVYSDQHMKFKLVRKPDPDNPLAERFIGLKFNKPSAIGAQSAPSTKPPLLKRIMRSLKLRKRR